VQPDFSLTTLTFVFGLLIGGLLPYRSASMGMNGRSGRAAAPRRRSARQFRESRHQHGILTAGLRQWRPIS